MESRPVQKFQWALEGEMSQPDKPRSASLVTPVSATPPSSASRKKRAVNSSPGHKPYSVSSLWDPISEETDNPLKCFLTLKPQAHKKPLASSLPLISFDPKKREENSQTRKKLPYQIITDCEHRAVPKMKLFQPETDLMVPTVPIRIKSKNDGRVRRSRPGAYGNDLNNSGIQGEAYVSRVPKLPSVSPTSDYTNFNHSSVFNSPRSHRTSLSNNSMVPMVPTPRDEDELSSDRVWAMPDFSAKNPAWFIGLKDKNELDVGTIYSKKQTAFYSRISREHTIVPPPSNCNRFLYDNIPNADYVTEKRYVKDNYHDKYTNLQRLSKDEVVFPQVYQSHLKKSKHQLSYLKSMLAKEEQKSQSSQPTCCRCGSDMNVKNNKYSSYIPDENNNINDLPVHKRKCFSPTKRRSADRSSERSSFVEKNHDPEWPKAVSAQFCDVLGKASCHNCTNYYTKRYQKKVEDTMTAEYDFIPQTPPATPDDIGVTLPTQGLHKIIIRVKDKEGVLAVASVGVNEDAITI